MTNLIRNNILIVDGDSEAVEQYRILFKDLYTLLITADLQDVAQEIEKHPVKVIIADLIQGVDNITHFFEQMAIDYPAIQRIWITHAAEQLFIQDAINKGRIFSYMTKPVEAHKLIITVEKAIEQHDLLIHNKNPIHDLHTRNENMQQLLSARLREEQKFRSIFEASPEPIFIIQSDGRIMEGNPAAHFAFGVSAMNAEKRNIKALLPTSEAENTLQYLTQIHQKWKPVLELPMNLPTDEIREFEISSFPVPFQGSHVFMVTLRDISVRKEMEMKILQSIIQTEERERSRFAQELHDGIGPLLSTAKLYLQWFNKPDSKMDKSMIIAKVEETLEETISNLREVSNNISPNTLINFGLNVALQSFIDRVQGASGITINYKNAVHQQLKSELEITLYRLLCECINNTLKHAEAQLISISLHKENDQLKIHYFDNGKGFNVDQAMEKAQGNGLLNMKTRVQSLGGTLILKSTPGKGTSISVAVCI